MARFDVGMSLSQSHRGDRAARQKLLSHYRNYLSFWLGCGWIVIIRFASTHRTLFRRRSCELCEISLPFAGPRRRK